MESWDFTILGTHEKWGDEIPLALSAHDRRQHVYVVGKTGSGKTTLLRNMIVQDIVQGRGVGVIDPHGDLAAEILDHIPPHRTDDVVYFNPSDFDNPIGFNLLSQVEPDKRHLVASGVVSIFKSIWKESWGPRLEYILYCTVAALLECENVSLLGVTRMLSDKRYRKWVVRQVRDPLVRTFWTQEFEAFDERFASEIVAPIQNKVGQLLMAAPVRNILGQVKRKIDPRFMMDNRRILVANLAKGKLGDDKANLLGALLVTTFQLAAMSRADMPENERTDFSLYVDEFQNFNTESIASVLSEARKYRLCLVLSHQYMEQLTPTIRAAVFGNVGSIIAFRVGHTDAEILEHEFAREYPASRFTDLAQYEICARLLANGGASVPLVAKTLPPVGTRHGCSENIAQRSREKYSVDRETVERRIMRWLNRRN